MRKWLALFLCLLSSAVEAQTGTPTKQSGYVTPSHATAWTTNGIIQDAGTAAIPYLTSLGTWGTGITYCASSAKTNTGGPYNQLCIGNDGNNNGLISFHNYGGQAQGNLFFNINGTLYQFPGTGSGNVLGPATSVIGDFAIWNNTAGTLLKDVAAPLPVTYGGTGQTTFTSNDPLLGNGTSGVGQGTLSGNTTKFVTAGSGSYVGCMQFDGSGNATGTGSNCGNAGATSPGGSNTEVQYNCSGAFCGAGDLVWNNSTTTLTGPDSATWSASGFAGLQGVNIGASGKLTWGSASVGAAGAGSAGNWHIYFGDSGGNYAAMFGETPSIHFVVRSGGTFCWSASTDPTADCALGFWNNSGTVGLGNAAGDYSGNFKAATITAGTAFDLADGGVLGTAYNTFLAPIRIEASGFGSNAGYVQLDTTNGGGLAIIGASVPGATGGSNQYQWTSLATQLWGCLGGSLCAAQGSGAAVTAPYIIAGPSVQNNTFQIGNLRWINQSGFTGAGAVTQLWLSDFFVDGVVTALGSITNAGTSCTPNTYTNYVLENAAGTSVLVQATIVVNSDGTVHTGGFTLTYGGRNASQGDVLTPASNNPIPGCSVQPSVAVATTSSAGLVGPSQVFWGIGTEFAGFGQRSTSPYDYTIFVGPANNTNGPWDYFTNHATALFPSGGLLLGTGNGTQTICNEAINDNSGAVAVTVCKPIATFSVYAGGTGGSDGTYTNVALTYVNAGTNAGHGATANITVSGGIVTAATINTPGTGYNLHDILTASSGAIGGTTGVQLSVATLGTTPAPISVSTVGISPATWADNQTCTAGQITADASYIYVCTSTNTVKRAALSTF